MDLGPMNVGHGATHEITCPSRTSSVRGLSRHSRYFRDVPNSDVHRLSAFYVGAVTLFSKRKPARLTSPAIVACPSG
jgi:hypothetical protein